MFLGKDLVDSDEKKGPPSILLDDMTWREVWSWLCSNVPEEERPLWIFCGGGFWLSVLGFLVLAVLFVRWLVR